MKNRKISIRLVFPVVMSASIAVCIISCMLLFSYYFSTYFQKDAIEKTGKQKNALAQSLEKEIDNMNDLTNSIYYQEIKEYDVADCSAKKCSSVSTGKQTRFMRQHCMMRTAEIYGILRIWKICRKKRFAKRHGSVRRKKT